MACILVSITLNIKASLDPLLNTNLLNYNCAIRLDLGRGYAWRPSSLAVNIGDTVEWRWGLNDLIDDMVFRVEETDTPSDYQYNGKGFQSSPQSTPAGTYQHMKPAQVKYFKVK